MKRKRNQERHRVENYFSAFFLLICVLSGDAWLLFAPKNSFSAEENRSLVSNVDFTISNVFDGSLMKSVEDFTGDQFLLRKPLITVNSFIHRGLGQWDLASDYSKTPADGGVYFGKDGHLYEALADQKSNIFDRNAEALKNFSKNAGIPLYILPVPSGSQEQAENLPIYAFNHDQRQEFNSLKSGLKGGTAVIDLFHALSLRETGNDYYFKTDHHWNTDGAYIGYRMLAKEMGIYCAPKSEFRYTANDRPFYGTLYSKVLDYGQEPDQMVLPVWKNFNSIVQLNGTSKHQGIYWRGFLTQKDQYSVYLGGNQPVTTVENPNARYGTILVMKDSFANSMIPYLATDFSKIYIVDLRYYNSDIYEFIKQNGIKKAAAIYSIKQLDEVNIANKLEKD